jgi:hypothetical protein
VTAQEAGRGLGDDLLVARMVEAEEPGEHPCRRVDGQGGVDVPRVDALYVDRASAGAGCWLSGGGCVTPRSACSAASADQLAAAHPIDRQLPGARK